MTPNERFCVFNASSPAQVAFSPASERPRKFPVRYVWASGSLASSQR